MAISLKKKVIALFIAFMAIFSISLLGAPSANAVYSEFTNAGNSDHGIIVSDGTNVYTVYPGQVIGGNIIGWWTEPYRCTSVTDTDSVRGINVTVNRSNYATGAWWNISYLGHRYYGFEWNC